MERNQKGQISTFLMVVGVICIVVAGGIFVTTAWKYMPELAKQLCLLLAAGGLFAGSHVLAKSGRLRKTETALYYLGVAFTGFFIISILGGISAASSTVEMLPDNGALPLYGTTWKMYQINAAKMLCAVLVMLIPTIIRAVRMQKGLDFCISVFFVDSMLICISTILEFNMEIFTLMLAGFILAFSVLDYWRMKQIEENQGLDIAVGVSYLIHGIICLPIIGVYLTDTPTMETTVLLIFMIITATGVTFAGREQAVYRITNSISILWGSYVIINELNHLLMWTEETLPVLFAAFMVNVVIMICMNRKEMYYILLTFGLLVPFSQAFIMHRWDAETPETQWYSCLPFSIVFAVACIVLWRRERKDSFLKVAGMQLMTAVLIWLFVIYTICKVNAGRIGFFDQYIVVFFLLNTILFLTIGLEIKSLKGKRIFATFALISGVLAGVTMAIAMVDVPEGYVTEWNCAVFGIGIVLLGCIWYDDKENVRIVQFVLTCLVLAVLLLHNLLGGEIGNVLILGIVSIIMLLVAAACNHKEYVIAASITLVLMIFYITRDFWLNIAWWIYLFVAGVVLVVLAVKKEKDA